MTKLLHNKIAKSKLALPVTAAFTLGVWLLGGLAEHGWWLQLGCFVLTAFLVVQLNNIHALIRIYSRMVSCAFLVLSCCACFLFPSLREGLMQTFVAAAYLILFTTYQDQTAAGRTFYAFVCLGLATMAYVHVFYLIPMIWVLMGTNLMALSWRTWMASVIGLLTPYWFAAGWLVKEGNWALAISHFAPLADIRLQADYTALHGYQLAVGVFVALLAIIGTLHFVRKSYEDKIRTRMFYYFLMWTVLLAAALLAVQPQHYDAMMRLMILGTAPLAGHYFALSPTRFTDIMFWTAAGTALVLTAIGIWNMSSLF